MRKPNLSSLKRKRELRNQKFKIVNRNRKLQILPTQKIQYEISYTGMRAA